MCCRDWRGLVHLTGVQTPSSDSPASQVLTAWEKDPAASLGQLEEYLGQLDRWDIVDDVGHLLRADAQEFMSRMVDVPRQSLALSEIDHRVLTFDDIKRLERGLELQMYDALLLYADEDQEYASQMLDRLENDYNFKVCLKESLVGGLSFEHQGIMRLISERCRRLIIILTRSFLNSTVNQFFVMFAHAIAVEKHKRIIIPCIYEQDQITLPMEISYIHKLDYNRICLNGYNFWEQLRSSVADAPVFSSTSNVTIREITNSATLHPPVPQRAIEPAKEQVAKPFVRAVKSEGATVDAKGRLGVTNAMTKSTNNLLSLSENICSNSPMNMSHKLSCSSLDISEKKSKVNYFNKIFRKVVTTKTKETKKSKKNKQKCCEGIMAS
ncbi:Myeloid differentiation primary response protein MyD88 [Homalodisca vitripennis]|nr:Myeloid differentiation primary response protein MyD88 [Homalodisca vitripennis]